MGQDNRIFLFPQTIDLIDEFLAPGYGLPGNATLTAIVLGARKEGLLVDPVYTGKVLAAVIDRASNADKRSTFIFVHTGRLKVHYVRVLE